MNVFTVAVLALCLASPALATPLDKDEKGFVTLVAMNFGVNAFCPGFETDAEGVAKFAQKYGVDQSGMVRATYAALNAQIGAKDTDTDALIPEVTRHVREVMAEMTSDYTNSKLKMCANYTKTLLNVGFIKRK